MYKLQREPPAVPVLQSPLVTSQNSVVSNTEPDAARSRNSASTRAILLVCLCTLTGAAAQILIKYGTNHVTQPGLWGYIRNLPLLAGLFLYGVNTVLMVMALRHGHLSVLYPIIALTYVWVTILSPMFFVDHLNVFKGVGVTLIVGGVSLIGIGSRQ